MSDKQAVIETIHRAFEGNEFPGEEFLQGSFEGCEPYDEVGPFRDKRDWTTVEAEFLDARSSALNFFSEAALRFFLPAYLIADLNDQLKSADPLFHLTGGFFDLAVNAPVGDRVFIIKSGKSAFINPRRYGAVTFGDYARYRLSVFTREEAGAIVAYLEFKRDHDQHGLDRPRIEAALQSFWLERARTAPPAEELRRHLAEQKEYIEAVQSEGTKRGRG